MLASELIVEIQKAIDKSSDTKVVMMLNGAVVYASSINVSVDKEYDEILIEFDE
ncbi:MAG: hypothetical protein R3Y59_02845 [bacterium]